MSRKYAFHAAVVFKRTRTNTKYILLCHSIILNQLVRLYVIVVATAAGFLSETISKLSYRASPSSFSPRRTHHQECSLRLIIYRLVRHSRDVYNIIMYVYSYMYNVPMYTTVQNKRVQKFLITRRSNIARVPAAVLRQHNYHTNEQRKR